MHQAMTSADNIMPFDDAAVAEMLSQFRRSPSQQEGWLWVRFEQALGERMPDFCDALSRDHAVATLPPDWPDAKCLGVDEQTTLVQCGTGTFLLADDPWSPFALRRLRTCGHAQARLALAQPGQRSHWGQPNADLARGSSSEAQPGTGVLSHPPENANNQRGSEEPPAQASTSVVDFVDAAILRAYTDGASDIHFETSRRGIQVKYRLDGVMVGGQLLADKDKAQEVISRIKVMGQLDITERRRPQDGRIRWMNAQGQGIDLRVSIMPSIFGEDAVLRLLDKAQLRHEAESISLDLLGFDAARSGQIRELASRPHGMLLVTGPTGSGKTTTVYAALSEVNDGLEKIVTIEDPVEYELPGVLQIPVNEQKGLTFATGLRSILRHDPDKILVGEIRDAETAQIAVQSALTGHLVFTTVHANSLLDVLGRFRHFGIEPFALASALNGVVVQRLLRLCCTSCQQWRALSQDEREQLLRASLPTPERVPVSAGCPSCRQTGYKGRTVLAEVHTLTDQIRDLMLTQESMSAFKALLYQSDQQRLAYQAIELVSRGRTTLQEVRRVVGLG
jgi:general secretion pathway protein E